MTKLWNDGVQIVNPPRWLASKGGTGVGHLVCLQDDYDWLALCGVRVVKAHGVVLLDSTATGLRRCKRCWKRLAK